MFDALFFMPGTSVFAAAAQRIPLDCLALVRRRAYLPGFQRTIEIREIILGRIPSPGHCTESRMRHKSFCEGGLFDYSGVLALGAGFRFGIHLLAYRAALKKHRLWMPSWCTPSALLQPVHVIQKKKKLIHLSEAPMLATAAQGTSTDCLALVTNKQGLISQSHSTVYICLHLKV